MSGNKLLKILKKPSLLFLTLGHIGFFNWMKDETYLKIAFRIRMGKKLNLKNPVSYSEKLQWLKLYNRNPLYTQLVDKSSAKDYVSNIIGKAFIIKTLGVYNNFEEINFDKMPQKFVIKCTHDSGGIVICKDKNHFDKKKARKVIQRCLKHNFYFGQREWPYKNVKPRIIVEEYLEDSETMELRDYKFFCFDGSVKALFIATDRYSENETCFDFFDSDFNHLPFENGHPCSKKEIEKPKCFDQMKEIASKLSLGFPQVRIDLYEVNGKVYFGEYTFFHWSGMMPFKPEKWDMVFGDWIDLPQKHVQ